MIVIIELLCKRILIVVNEDKEGKVKKNKN